MNKDKHSGKYFQGQIVHVRVYNYALSPAQILQLYRDSMRADDQRQLSSTEVVG